MTEFVYGEKVRVNLTGGSYLDTFIALTPGGERAVLLGADGDKPYTVPTDLIEVAPNLDYIAMKVALHYYGPEEWPGFGCHVEHAAREILEQHFSDVDVPRIADNNTTMLNVFEDYTKEMDEWLYSGLCRGCGYSILDCCSEDYPAACPALFMAFVEAAK